MVGQCTACVSAAIESSSKLSSFMHIKNVYLPPYNIIFYETHRAAVPEPQSPSPCKGAPVPGMQLKDDPRSSLAERSLPFCLGPFPSSCSSSHCIYNNMQTSSQHTIALRNAIWRVVCTIALTAQDCSRMALGACPHLKWSLWHPRHAHDSKVDGLSRGKDWMLPHTHMHKTSSVQHMCLQQIVMIIESDAPSAVLSLLYHTVLSM